MTGTISGTDTMINPYPQDWRKSDERFQQRSFLLSSFIRSNRVLYSDVYEFCDHAISQGYGETLNKLDLKEVDPWLMRMYDEWKAAYDTIR